MPKKNPVVTDEPMVDIILPLPPESESGLNRDMCERVTINGHKWTIKRGERVSVPVSVFDQLRNRYPNI